MVCLSVLEHCSSSSSLSKRSRLEEEVVDSCTVAASERSVSDRTYILGFVRDGEKLTVLASDSADSERPYDLDFGVGVAAGWRSG